LFNVDEVAEELRQKPYHLFRSDCLTKSIHLVKECKKHNINAKLVWCALGLERIKLPIFGGVTIPIVTHFWVEVNGRRIETSRPLGSSNFLGFIPSNIRPIVTIKF
jgi:hypothetical protein